MCLFGTGSIEKNKLKKYRGYILQNYVLQWEMVTFEGLTYYSVGDIQGKDGGQYRIYVLASLPESRCNEIVRKVINNDLSVDGHVVSPKAIESAGTSI